MRRTCIVRMPRTCITPHIYAVLLGTEEHLHYMLIYVHWLYVQVPTWYRYALQ